MFRLIPAIASIFVLLPGCGQASLDATATNGAPSETRPPNSSFKPAVAGQTRAPTRREAVAFEVEEVAQGLDVPWSLEFLPDGRMLVSERSGSFRFVTPDGRVSAAGAGLPPVFYEGQGGLLDIALDPDFKSSRLVYWTYSEPREGGNGTAVARGRLSAGERPDVSDVEVIFRMQPTVDSANHFGSRIAFARDGSMFVSLGERADEAVRGQAQELGSDLGKIVHINRDGSIPAGNPFVDRAGARPEIWSYGHRNPQGIAVRPATGQLWEVEHGPRGGDEFNLIEKGVNYGWPVITYGIDYDGEPIGDGIAVREGMRQPVYYWDPVIAPSSLLFYSGAMFPAWRDSAFFGGLGGQKLVRLTLEGDKVIGEEWLLADREERYRDVREGPDGALYLLTEEGKILRLHAP